MPAILSLSPILLLLQLVTTPACRDRGDFAVPAKWQHLREEPYEVQKLITELLQCSLAHSVQCRQFLQAIEANRPSQSMARLAAVLLEEWDVRPTDAALTKPRLVWAPWPTHDELKEVLPKQAEWSVTVVTGVVQPDGRVADAKLLKASSYELLDDRILLAFAQAQYRPARVGNAFVEQRADYLYRLEPR